MFQKNGFPENFIDSCFKLPLIRIHILKEKVPTVEKKPLRLFLLYLGIIRLQFRAKLQNSIKCVLTCCKLKIFLKVKDPVP